MKNSIVLILSTCLALLVNVCSAQRLKNEIIAHRGAWKADGLPENSIASLQRAIELGCGGAEFDVWMTADSVVVVNHNPTHQGLVIEASTYRQLAEKKLPNGETIPTLEEYIRAAQHQRRTKLILEIKPSKVGKQRVLALTETCVATVKRLKARNLVAYISFDYDACLKVIALDRKANVSYLGGEEGYTPAQLKKDRLSGLDYHISVYKKHPEYFRQARELGLTTNIWTLVKIEDMQWALEQGVDFITTDEPKAFLEQLKK